MAETTAIGLASDLLSNVTRPGTRFPSKLENRRSPGFTGSILMRERVGRKLGVLDAMILVATVALWLTVTRHLRMEINPHPYLYPGEYGLLHFIRRPIGLALLFLSTAMLLIRLRPP